MSYAEDGACSQVDEDFFNPSSCSGDNEIDSSANCVIRFICTFEGCNKSFSCNSSLIRHAKFGHCSDEVRDALLSEQRAKKREKEKPYQKNKSNSGSEKFLCGIDGCLNAYTTPYGLKLHKQANHGDNRSMFKCPICTFNMEFSYKGSLQRHMIQEHGQPLDPKLYENPFRKHDPKPLRLVGKKGTNNTELTD